MLKELRNKINKDYFNVENYEFFKSMKDTFAKREYKCKCGRVNEDYVWQSLLEHHKVTCVKCGKELGINNLAVKEKPQLHSIRTDTKNR